MTHAAENAATWPDVVFISLERWDEIWRRNQFVCAELARRHPNSRILFVTPPRDISNALRSGRLNNLRQGTDEPPVGLPNIRVVTLNKWLPNTLEFSRRLNVWNLRRQLLREMQRGHIRNPLLWINDHSLFELVGTLGEQSAVYDITDDWTTLEQADWLKQRINEQDRRLCQSVDAVIVCSQRLFELKQSRTRNLHLVPNGVEAAHYAQVLDTPAESDGENPRWMHPVLGYTGSLHADRVDIELVRAIAGRLRGTIVFVGPDMLSSEQRSHLTRCDNVVIHGPVRYANLPKLMQRFDVCIVPHRVSAFTESLNPLKLWEYLAAGKPIISTPVAGFRDFPELVHLAVDVDQFVAALESALSEDPAIPRKRREEASRHSWNERIDQIEQIVRSVCRGPRLHNSRQKAKSL
jgi:teichuronic acid biosynthesis glycosyltransferase TuaH